MQLIPAVDVLGGRVVRLMRGEYDRVTEYGSDPVAAVAGWVEQGAPLVHVVDLEGARSGALGAALWQRLGDAGLPFTFNYCANCGTTVWWSAADPDGPLRDKIAVAGGCFASSGFPSPTLSIYEKHKEPWLHLPAGIRHLDSGI